MKLNVSWILSVMCVRYHNIDNATILLKCVTVLSSDIQYNVWAGHSAWEKNIFSVHHSHGNSVPIIFNVTLRHAQNRQHSLKTMTNVYTTKSKVKCSLFK